jgi:hypothetical protein
MFEGILNNSMFGVVSIFTIGCQVILIEFGDDFMKTTPLSFYLWIVSIVFGAVTIPIGALMRLCLPVDEDPQSYANNFDMHGVDGPNEQSVLEKPSSGTLLEIDNGKAKVVATVEEAEEV